MYGSVSGTKNSVMCVTPTDNRTRISYCTISTTVHCFFIFLSLHTVQRRICALSEIAKGLKPLWKKQIERASQLRWRETLFRESAEPSEEVLFGPRKDVNSERNNRSDSASTVMVPK
jgi:hypothetical protein